MNLPKDAEDYLKSLGLNDEQCSIVEQKLKYKQIADSLRYTLTLVGALLHDHGLPLIATTRTMGSKPKFKATAFDGYIRYEATEEDTGT